MNRCDALRKALPDAYIVVHRPENIRWLTGYTGEGCVFVSPKRQVIITDFRYIEAASRQSPQCEIERTQAERTEANVLKALCDSERVEKLYVETDYLTFDAVTGLSKVLQGVSLLPLNQAPQTLRLIKDSSEVESMKKAAAISCQALSNILDRIRPGLTEKQVQIMLDYEMLSLGSEGNAFDTIAASGPNGSLPHAVPSDYVIQKGELLTLDFGATVDGYCADMTRTLAIGKVSDDLSTLYHRVLKAQTMALDALGPGKVCGDIDKIARDYLDGYYPGAFGHSLGHGVGLFIHEQPRLAKGSATVLQPGNVVTVEPGVYIPGLGGCRIEDMTIITEDGYIDPVTFPKELIEL
ncbi:MAG: aminopeptidase P family protein [Clostridia bacterium]|nr:aminopeptidase P family protein [Clostridia bacterium]